MPSLMEIKNESSSLYQRSVVMAVDNQDRYEIAADFIKVCMGLKSKVELFFNPSIEQFKKAKKEAETGRKQQVEKMNEVLSPINEALMIMRQKCKNYEDEKIKEAEQEEANRIEEMATLKKEGEENWDEDKVELAETVDVTKKPEIQKVTNLGIRRPWKWKVVNTLKIPPEYLVLNMVKINKEVRENKENTNIPGIEVYQD